MHDSISQLISRDLNFIYDPKVKILGDVAAISCKNSRCSKIKHLNTPRLSKNTLEGGLKNRILKYWIRIEVLVRKRFSFLGRVV